MLKGIVWGATQQEALDKLAEIKANYEKIGRKIIANRENEFTSEDGDRWMAVRCTDNARAHSCNISYISKRIPEDKLQRIVMHATKAYPYQAIKYYD